jgi:hypothetical protein
MSLAFQKKFWGDTPGPPFRDGIDGTGPFLINVGSSDDVTLIGQIFE